MIHRFVEIEWLRIALSFVAGGWCLFCAGCAALGFWLLVAERYEQRSSYGGRRIENWRWYWVLKLAALLIAASVGYPMHFAIVGW